MENPLPSKYLQQAVEQMASLPSVGKRTALRLVLHMLKWDASQVKEFGDTFSHLHERIAYCKKCHNISDTEICSICANPKRNENLICIVESVQDVLAVEATLQYNGVYHVLGGVIAPLEGIGPGDLTIELLMERLATQDITEVIIALNGNMEGETTAYYLYKRIKEYCDNVSTLARGIGFSDELEFTDEVSLGKSIINRTPFEKA